MTSGPSTDGPARPGIGRGLTFLFAVAAGAAVGNLYWAQPLLDVVATDLHTSTASAGWLVTTTQLGYALGILLVVPLGDVTNRRRLVPAALVAAAVALGLCAVAPSFGFLVAALFVLGLTTVGGQLLTPLAGDLASDADRGAVVGTVVSGILTGILLSRTVSGVVADAFGWRSIYVGAAVLDLVLAVLLWRAIPDLEPKARVTYGRLIASVFAVVRRERVVRWTLLLAGISFALFTMFWTSLTFLLSGPPFDFSVSVIGLFGLVGLVGAIAAQRAGRLHDRGWSVPASGVGWALVVVAFVIGALGGGSVVGVVVAILLLDVAIQGIGILNQTRMFAVSAEERSRLNTAFVTNNFLWGAGGSVLATVLWAAGGWYAVTLVGAGLAAVALVVWAFGRRGPLVVPVR
ncbi:Predicted arabinose efflux permease, MFS family [Microlunatus sagamiharensis]|uniref:Predicted arabinose efflux permease, MFS family n=1 Tax=Microlunatus sagamiharensis TaxID=546874 RepID=A0A1H2NA99_9ACTN|nr:MFS transporter [Microlunatus sagamiharensis]SDV02302.1 Predicted arabinose efflux permease, MFS family [Microlunatus sagamiharensis]